MKKRIIAAGALVATVFAITCFVQGGAGWMVGDAGKDTRFYFGVFSVMMVCIAFAND